MSAELKLLDEEYNIEVSQVGASAFIEALRQECVHTHTLTPKEAENAANIYFSILPITSLDQPLLFDGIDGDTLADHLPQSTYPDPAVAVEYSDLLQACKQSLAPKPFQSFYLRTIEELEWKEVGNKMGCTFQHAIRLYHQAILILQHSPLIQQFQSNY